MMTQTIREEVAQAIFEAREFGAPCAWVPYGNSFKQDEARSYARCAIAAMRPVIEAAHNAGALYGWAACSGQKPDCKTGAPGTEYATRIIAELTGKNS
jgi:hypothetical protein